MRISPRTPAPELVIDPEEQARRLREAALSSSGAAAVPDPDEELRRADAARMAAPTLSPPEVTTGQGDYRVALQSSAPQGGVKIMPRTPPAPVPPPSVQTNSPGLVVGPRPAPAVNLPPASEVEPPSFVPQPQPQTSGPVVADNGVKAPYEDAASAEEIALRMIEDRPVKNRDKGFWANLRGAGKVALIAAGEHARAHPATTWQELAGSLGAGGAGLLAGSVDRSLDERLDKQADVAEATARVERGFKVQERGARIRQLNADANLKETRPELEGRKLQLKQLVETEKARLGGRRMTETERHNAAVETLRERGLISTDEYRAAVLVDRDEDRGQRERFEAGRNEDRDESRADAREYRRALVGLSSERLAVQLSTGLGSSAKREFDVRTKGLFERRRQIETQINQWNTKEAKGEMSPAARERQTSTLRGELETITDEIEGARREALNAMSSAPAGAPASAPADSRTWGEPAAPASRLSGAGAPPTGRKWTEAKVREWARKNRRDEGAAVNAARERGLLQ